MLPYLLHQVLSVARDRLLCSSHAHARHSVDESGADIGNLFQPLVGAGRSRHEHRAKSERPHLGDVMTSLFDRKIGDEDAIDARFRAVGAEVVEPVTKDRIEVAEYDQARIAPVAYLPGDPQHISDSSPVLQRSLAGPLDDRSVGDWVAERY